MTRRMPPQGLRAIAAAWSRRPDARVAGSACGAALLAASAGKDLLHEMAANLRHAARGQDTITEAELDAVATYTEARELRGHGARCHRCSRARSMPSATPEGSYCMPSAEGVLSAARTAVLMREVEDHGITVSDEELLAYASETFGTDDIASLANTYGMDEETARARLSESAAIAKLRAAGGGASRRARARRPASPEKATLTRPRRSTLPTSSGLPVTSGTASVACGHRTRAITPRRSRSTTCARTRQPTMPHRPPTTLPIRSTLRARTRQHAVDQLRQRAADRGEPGAVSSSAASRELSMDVVVSACLLGEPVATTAAASPRAVRSHLASACDVHPVCPETAGGLPAPRPPAERVGRAGAHARRHRRDRAFVAGPRLCRARRVRMAHRSPFSRRRAPPAASGSSTMGRIWKAGRATACLPSCLRERGSAW